MSGFLNELKVQRWDDHRYYHHSKVNQSLHFVSATSFLCAYVMAFGKGALALLLGRRNEICISEKLTIIWGNNFFEEGQGESPGGGRHTSASAYPRANAFLFTGWWVGGAVVCLRKRGPP